MVPEPAEQSASLEEPRADYVLVLMIYLCLRLVQTTVLSCSGTRNDQAFMRDWGSWITPEAPELDEEEFVFMTALKPEGDKQLLWLKRCRGHLHKQKWDEV